MLQLVVEPHHHLHAVTPSLLRPHGADTSHSLLMRVAAEQIFYLGGNVAQHGSPHGADVGSADS